LGDYRSTINDAGPGFTEAENGRAVDAFNLWVQDQDWREGESRFDATFLLNELRAKGLTRALALALMDWLIQGQVLREMVEDIPAGVDWLKPLPPGNQPGNGVGIYR